MAARDHARPARRFFREAAQDVESDVMTLLPWRPQPESPDEAWADGRSGVSSAMVRTWCRDLNLRGAA